MNIFQKAITPDMPRVLEGEQIYVYVPQATSTNAGIASYKNADFKVNDGVVSLRWPIQSIVQGPLATPSLIKVQDTEFEYSNVNTELEYEGSTINSAVSEIQIKRDLRDAYNRPDLVMLDPNYFVRTIIEKDGKQYYKHHTTAVHYNMSQKLSDAEQAQARLNIGAGSLAVVEQSNKNSSEALSKASSAEQTSIEALEIIKTSDAAAKEAVVTANKALANAGQAITTSDAALNASNNAIAASNTAINTANNAIATANAAKIESASAKSGADTAAANATTALNTSQEAKNIAGTAEQIAQNALDLITDSVGTQVLVNGEAVLTFNADTKADVTYVNQKIDEIMGPGSTEAIDTILELANAFKNNSDVIKVLNESISTKANASDVTNMLATKANTSDLANYVTKTGYTMRASDTVGEFYYNTGAGEKSISIKMPTIPVTSVNGLTGDVVIDTSKYLTSSDLSGYVQYADIINNLTSTATNKVLSAYQGKVLNDLITSLSNNKANTSDLANYLSLKTGGEVNGAISATSVSASVLVSRGDVQAQYLQAAAAGHETGDYDKIATLSSTGYVRYRTKAELKSDLGFPTDYVTTETLTSNLANYLSLTNGGTISGPIILNGGDGTTKGNIQLLENGQITDGKTATLFGRVSTSAYNLIVGHSNYVMQLRGKNNRVTYNGSNLALQSDVPTFSLDGTTLTITI